MLVNVIYHLKIWEERNETKPVDYETIFKHIQQLNELIADGSEVKISFKLKPIYNFFITFRWKLTAMEQPFIPGHV